VDHHDGVFLREHRRVAPVRSFVELCTPGEGPQGHEASHHAAVLELLPNGVCVVWVGILEKPLEVVRRRPCRMVAAAHVGRDSSCAAAMA
jgi:hypothetical protein